MAMVAHNMCYYNSVIRETKPDCGFVLEKQHVSMTNYLKKLCTFRILLHS